MNKERLVADPGRVELPYAFDAELVREIVERAAEVDIAIDPVSAFHAWRTHSHDFSAAWLQPSGSAEVADVLRRYCVEVDNG